MLKESTAQQRFVMIQNFLPLIIQKIRKDLRQDHLKCDKDFLNSYFGGRSPNKLTVEDLVAGYSPLLKEGNEKLWEFFSDRWLRKHTEIYYFFEAKLKEIDEDFTELKKLKKSEANCLVQEATNLFGATNTYIFSVLNSVVFPKAVYEKLLKEANCAK